MPDDVEAGARQLQWPDDLLPGLGPSDSGEAFDVPVPDPAPLPTPPTVVVRTSRRRRKTASAHWEGSQIVVLVPAHVGASARHELVDDLVQRLLAKRPHLSSSDATLESRAHALADSYLDGIRPASIRWVSNQSKRWGSCSVRSGHIRISHRLRVVPSWVLDATIVHELAHLVYPNHSRDFHALADRFPRQREASAFLEGYSLGLEREPETADVEQGPAAS